MLDVRYMRLLRLRRVVVPALIVLALPGVAVAATARIDIRTTATPPVTGKLMLRSVRPEATGEKAVAVRVPGTAEVEVDEGMYIAELNADGAWLSPQVVTIRDGITIALQARPTGMIGGTSSPASPVEIRFTSTTEPLIAGEARCVNEKESFRCVLPAGTFDLRVGADGYVPQYRFATEVQAARTERIGTVALVPGGSIAGQLESESGEARNAKLSLARADGKGAPSALKVTSRGFFSVGPLPPGDYVLTAAQKGLVSVPVTVNVRDGAEARLREAIVLAKPRRLAVIISPPIDPIAVGWEVGLRQLGPPKSAPRLVAEGAASLDGSWSADGLLPGRYEIMVRPKGGPVWHVEALDIEDALTTRQVLVQSIRFEGTVRYGDAPLAAKLRFRGDHDIVSIPWRSDERGEFHGYMAIPKEKRWIVSVTADVPAIDVTLHDVPMHLNEAEGVARIAIELPATVIEGTVIDERNAPVKHALINVEPRDPRSAGTQVTSDERGEFTVSALAPGAYRVTAAAYLQESEAVEIAVAENGDEPPPLRLQVKSYRKWAGRITTTRGQPIQDARIIAAAVDVPVVSAYPAHSDADGRFVLLVPASARLFDMIVAPRGYVYNYFRRPFSDELNIVVNPAGGTLVVDVPDDRSLEAAIWHNGSVLSGHSFLSTWVAELAQNASGTTRLRIPQLDPGLYTLCLVPAGTAATSVAGPHCQSTYVAPFNETSVTLMRTRS